MLRTKKPPEQRPELLLSLNYLPQAERLTIVVMKAKNLDTTQEPYVKVSRSRYLSIDCSNNYRFWKIKSYRFYFTLLNFVPAVPNNQWKTCQKEKEQYRKVGRSQKSRLE